MSGTDRYVVLGLGRPRSPWFNELTRWVTTGVVPIEFVRCLTVDETRVQLGSGRRWSALVVDASVPGIDRDLLETVAAAGCTPLVIADPRVDRPWLDLGARAVLPSDLDRDTLLAALAEHARPVGRPTPRITLPASTVAPPPWRGRLLAVTGGGGTGSSVVAALLAQGLGADVRQQGLVLLADLALDADQAVLHDVGDVMPGLPELVDAHRLGDPDPDDVRALIHPLATHGYDLLLGLRRHRDWTALRPRAVASAIDGLRRIYRSVVVDVDIDLEGEPESGSPDIEERNVLARTTIPAADVVVVVGRPGTLGAHQLARTVRRLVDHGVAPERLLLVINRAARSTRQRAETTATVAALVGAEGQAIASPVALPDKRQLEEVIRSGGRWPESMSRSVASAVEAILDRDLDPHPSTADVPERITPGTLGSFTPLHGDSA